MHLLLYVQCSTPFPLPHLLSINHYFVSVYISLFYTFGGPEKDLDLNHTHCFIYVQCSTAILIMQWNSTRVISVFLPQSCIIEYKVLCKPIVPHFCATLLCHTVAYIFCATLYIVKCATLLIHVPHFICSMLYPLSITLFTFLNGVGGWGV